MLAAVIQILDTTIANVALPHMQGTLSATQDQISWVLTSYIVAAAIRIGGERAERTLHRYIEPIGWGALALLAAAIGWLALRGHAA